MRRGRAAPSGWRGTASGSAHDNPIRAATCVHQNIIEMNDIDGVVIRRLGRDESVDRVPATALPTGRTPSTSPFR
eukprot:6637689-Prymnesium_polylepis.1